jgi:hypothetical protein
VITPPSLGLSCFDLVGALAYFFVMLALDIVASLLTCIPVVVTTLACYEAYDNRISDALFMHALIHNMKAFSTLSEI